MNKPGVRSGSVTRERSRRGTEFKENQDIVKSRLKGASRSCIVYLVAAALVFPHAAAPAWGAQGAWVASDGALVFAQAQPRRTVAPQPRPRPGSPQAQNQAADPQFQNQTGQTVDEPLWMQYNDVPLINVIEQISNQTGKNYEVDPAVGQEKVTVISHEPVTPDMVDEILEALLSSKGIRMVETLEGQLYKIFRAPGQQGNVNTDKIPLFIGPDDLPDGYDTVSTHVRQIKHASSEDLKTILEQMGSASNRIDVYAPTNTLIITDTADGIRKIFRLIETLDIPGYDTVLDIFQLNYQNATDLSTMLQEVLMGGDQDPAGAQGRPTPARPTPVRTIRPNVPGQPQGVTVGSLEETLRMVPDERLNLLIVVASEHLMERVRDLIDKLDTPTPFEQNTMHYVPLLNADAEAVAEALNAITGTPRAGGGGGGGRGGGGGGQQTAEVQPFEKEVVIEQYEQTNSLLIVAAPQDYKLLQEIIAQLDVPQRQVMIESRILQVTLNDNLSLSVEATALTGNDAFALSNVVELANLLANGPLAVAGLGLTSGIIDGTTEITVPTGIDPDTGQPTGLALQTIPNVPLLLRALETLSDIDVLSLPSLTTVDNEEASIVVGQEIPVVSTLSDVNDRTGFNARARVERVDVGVKMTVTPQINEGDYVSIESQIEVSEVVDSGVGIDPNQIGATFDKSEVSNKIVIPDGSTGVIGGLISANRNRSTNQVPLLGDIPILGFFFRSKGIVRRKRNLVVLLTPHIVKEGQDLARITDYKLREFDDKNIDALFERGFIKKQRMKYRGRVKERPTDDYLDAHIRQGEKLPADAYGRGDIE